MLGHPLHCIVVVFYIYCIAAVLHYIKRYCLLEYDDVM